MSSKLARVIVVAVSVGLLFPAPSAVAAARGGSSGGLVAADFNGDGRDDLAIGVNQRDIGSATDAGIVHVLYGTSNELKGPGSQLWSQDKSGVQGEAQSGDLFGSILAAGDFDRDGFDDLAIASPYDADPNTGEVAGSVNVLYGSHNGLSAEHDDFWYQDSPNIKGSTDDGDEFGAALATGNLGHSRADDLVIGAPGDILSVGMTDIGGAGSVHVLYGSSNGLTPAGNEFWHQASPGVPGDPETNDFFGDALAIGDLGKSKSNDLAIGVPYEDSQAGIVQVLYGRPNGGLTAEGDDVVKQGVHGVPDAAEPEEWTGYTLAIGQLGKGKRSDLVVAAPFENSSASDYSGIVIVLYGKDSGISSQGSQKLSRTRLGKPTDNDVYGGDFVIANLIGNARNDLAITSEFGTAGTVDDAGAVDVVRGSKHGLRLNSNKTWSQDSPGIADACEPGDSFGLNLSFGDFRGSGRTDLAVGAPGEGLGAFDATGAAHVIYGKAIGLSSPGDQFWSQDSPGIQGDPQSQDFFSSYFRSLE